MDVVGRTFKPLRRSLIGFQIKNLGNNTLLFIFDNPEDVDRVISSEPWSFNKHLVVVQKYDINVPIQDACFNKASFWVQVHDIPFRYMTTEIVEDICGSVGEVNRYDHIHRWKGGALLGLGLQLT